MTVLFKLQVCLQVTDSCGLYKGNYRIIIFPWDPGASKLLLRVGGKPKLKKGGMLSPVSPQRLYRPKPNCLSDNATKATTRGGEGIDYSEEQNPSPPFLPPRLLQGLLLLQQSGLLPASLYLASLLYLQFTLGPVLVACFPPYSGDGFMYYCFVVLI